MKTITSKKRILSTFSLLFSVVIFAQISQDQIVKSYETFVGSPREIAYAHLNKSTLIKNEMLGFTAYVFDKFTKQPSLVTKNLYCTISDQNDKVIKSKLVEVNRGVSSNIFKIDSLFNSGKYTFRAYTNWMLNFDERNYYEHTITIIDPDQQKEIVETTTDAAYKIQVLPEGGHLVKGINNYVGVIVKDSDGFGLANASGLILDNKNQMVKDFTLNQFGIAKVSLTPEEGKTYKVLVSKGEKIIESKITDIQDIGFNVSLFSYTNKIALLYKANKKSMPYVKGKSYILAIHNGTYVKVAPFQFGDNDQVVQALSHDNLYPGINIFTVFDPDKNIPILERMFFNWKGIPNTDISSVSTTKANDSILVSLKIDETIDLKKVQNLSISVLPKNTKSYQFNTNILSQTYLNSYVKGFIENAGYYFSNNSKKVKSDLDNLLITQGWSSYDWTTIFKKPEIKHRFESGIDVVANINDTKEKKFMVYPLKGRTPNIVEIADGNKKFTHANIFPYEKDSYGVSILKKSGKTKKAGMYLQFFPSEVPTFDFSFYKTPLRDLSLSISSVDTNPIVANWDIEDTELLGEVVVKSKYRRSSRIEEIRNRSFGNVHVFDDKDRRNYRSIAQYLSGRGFRIENSSIGRYTIEDRNPASPNATNPIFMLNGIVTEDFNFIYYLRMDEVDFIDINKGGMGLGVRGGRTLIKIVTNPLLSAKSIGNSGKNVSQYPFSLTFSTAKKFYTPFYSSRRTKFFKEYGVIDWIPNISVSEDGIATFKIPNNYRDEINLYIEGIINGKGLISQTKTINR
ncbi:hypothetical protein AAON49_08960 [Pseudotenacibaculum sp. MALMAid0570]|uniref:hypothetical protein n=1 Tax=Pseudotenacibaculum sp. MALMAid0570 TaxID=3143938 RepID=UPI0032E02466